MAKKTVKRRWLILAAVILAVVAILPILEPVKLPGNSLAEHLNAGRRRLLAPEQVVQAMKISPGSTVLDLGAGYGMFTFLLSQAVGESGRVFATDADSKAVAAVTAEAQKQHATNVTTVQVSASGVDPFYQREKFDQILMSDCIQDISNPEAFLHNLRPSLNSQGRLWIIVLRLDASFDPMEFEDDGKIITALHSPDAENLIARRIPTNEWQQLISAKTPISQATRELLVTKLNGLLDDPTLWPDLKRYHPDFESHTDSRKSGVRKHVIRKLERQGVFNANSKSLTDDSRPLLRLLNRLIIQDLFETNAWERALSFDRLKFKDWQFIIDSMPAHGGLVELLERAGYELVQEHDLLTSYRVVEFRAKN